MNDGAYRRPTRQKFAKPRSGASASETVCHWRGLGNHLVPGETLPETPGKLDLLYYERLHPRNLLFGAPEYVAEKIRDASTTSMSTPEISAIGSVRTHYNVEGNGPWVVLAIILR